MAVNTQTLNAKSVLRYAFMPGIIPRAKRLGSGGFGYLAFLFANLYQAVRILPPNHPYLQTSNIGKFSVLQVIAAAANNLEISKRNIDQIIVFAAVIIALVLMVLQFALLIAAFLSGKAFAAVDMKSLFVTQYPQTDVAFLLLDYVFGIPLGTGAGPSVGFFGSLAIPTGPTPFHEGLHALFNFYNLAILLVGVIIFLYYVFVVVIETAQTGVPFGQRFSKIYAPLRLIAAIGLLVPLNYGFNGAQYLTLYAASMGSSFATNGWILYNENLSNPLGADNTSLVANPQAPSQDELLYFSSVYHACRDMYGMWAPDRFLAPTTGIVIKPYVIVDGTAQDFTTYSYEQAKVAFNKSDIEVVLGEYDATKNKEYAGGVRPYCGKMTISLSNDNPSFYSSDPTDPSTTKGVRAVESLYYKAVQELLGTSGPGGGSEFVAFGERVAHSFVTNSAHDECWRSSDLKDDSTCGSEQWFPPSSVFQPTLSAFRSNRQAALETAYNDYKGGLSLKLSEDLKKRGWGGAGIWYHMIADINGSFTAAIYASPTIKAYPEVMEYVKQKQQEKNKAIGPCDFFTPNLGDGQDIKYNQTNEERIAAGLNAAYKYFACDRQNQETGGTGTGAARVGGAVKGMTNNVFINAMSLIFGLNGLFDISASSEPNPVNGQPRVHPLAQLTTIGKSLVENSIRSMAVALGASFGGGLVGVLSSGLGAALNSFSGMFVGIATIGLTAGFILYYILPFLPFIYFFFAVGSWVKAVFEAMVGVPLWALAHLKIDGNGFSGEAARGGYLLIFEIFLRPIATLFGLIGGMAVFSASVVAMNILFKLVVINATGSSPDASVASIPVSQVELLRRGTIDQFFFTIMLSILMYMMGTSSFKMIDTIPEKFMRWFGGDTPAFHDRRGDMGHSLTQYAALGGAKVSSQILGGMQRGASGLGSLFGAFGKMASDASKGSGGAGGKGSGKQ